MLRMRDTIPHVRGLARNARGLGLRTTLQHYEAVQQAALSAEEMARRRRTVYEIDDVPVDLDADALRAELAEMQPAGWGVHPIRSGFPRTRPGLDGHPAQVRRWIVGAAEEPPAELLSFGGRLCPVRVAPKRPPQRAAAK
eukprot:gene11805-3989_t